MSDIGFYGLGSILVLLALACFFLLGGALCALLAWLGSRRGQARFTRTPYFPHLVGLATGLLGCLGIMLLLEKGYLLFPDATGYSADYLRIPRWLDEHAWYWGTALVLLWPLGVTTLKFRRRRESIPT